MRHTIQETERSLRIFVERVGAQTQHYGTIFMDVLLYPPVSLSAEAGLLSVLNLYITFVSVSTVTLFFGAGVEIICSDGCFLSCCTVNCSLLLKFLRVPFGCLDLSAPGSLSGSFLARPPHPDSNLLVSSCFQVVGQPLAFLGACPYCVRLY